VLRIGGDSTDLSYAPSPGVTPPPYVAYKLTPSWMATTAALARGVGARMTLGLNLVANEPVLAAAEARDYGMVDVVLEHHKSSDLGSLRPDRVAHAS